MSTTPMTRNADLMLSASILSTAAIEAALAKVFPSVLEDRAEASSGCRWPEAPPSMLE